MAVDVIMPQMGESIFEGTITKWLKKPGDKVERDEPLFEISTDKVDAEIPAPSAGTLKEIKIGEGQTVPIQTVVAVIDADGAAAAAPPPAAPKAAAPAAPPPPAPKAEAPLHFEPTTPAAPPAARPATAAAAPSRPPTAGGDGQKVRSSPLVRRIAREKNIDLTQVSGTGAGGRVSKKDILGAVEQGTGVGAPARVAAAPSAPGVAGGVYKAVIENAVPRERIYFGHHEVQPMSTMRQKIAEHMLSSKHVSAHVYSIDEADVSKIAALRNRTKDEFEKRHGVKLSFMPFFVKAAVEALRAFPTANASVDGNNVVLHKECNIGIAVALDWGLIVPVIKNAEEKNFLGLQRAINDLAERARTKKLPLPASSTTLFPSYSICSV